MTDKTILLTFDVEEFDLPAEYGNPIDIDEQISISAEGLHKIIALLNKHEIRATFFVTANFAVQNPLLIREISEKHEIASHSYFHSGFKNSDIKDSKLKLEEITGKRIYGFRMPRLEKTDRELIKKSGYSYDSSINPTIIPGRYNHFFKPRTIHTDSLTELIIVPFSVSPFIRFPLFWLAFKNISYPLYLLLCRWTMKNDHYLHLFFHPWEFSAIGHYAVPDYTKKIYGNELLSRLDSLLTDLKKEGHFTTIFDFINNQATGNKSAWGTIKP